MKDRQILQTSTEPRIPFVSAFLHCVAMTALVYFRSSFGYAFLRPKSVFFAFSWAFILFTVFAWHEPAVWRDYRFLCLFGTGSVLLYWLNLLVAYSREWQEAGEHDNHSGTSHPIWFVRRGGRLPENSIEKQLHLWIEPATLFVFAGALRLGLDERPLSKWLLFAGLCYWSKEALNRWFHLRQRKRQGDIFDDSEDMVEAPETTNLSEAAPKGVRKPKQKRIPKQENVDERRFAELLRLLPPYTLLKAEENYHTLIKGRHPDTNDGIEESTTKSADLNEAITFFRDRFGG